MEHLYGPIDGCACERAADAIHKAAKARGKRKITTPDRWPHEILYPSDDTTGKEGGPGYMRVVCLACKGMFGIKESASWTFCPYCAMTLRRVVLGEMKKAV